MGGHPLYKTNFFFRKGGDYCILRNVVSEKLHIPKATTELFKKNFTYSGPKLWNELPFSIRQASSHNTFKTEVKSLILNDDVP